MILRRLWPKSLAGQLVLLVAVALFVAQAINLSLMFEGRRQMRIQQIIGPTVARLVDADEHTRAGRLSDGFGERRFRGRVRLLSASPIRTNPNRQSEIETLLTQGLAEAGLKPRVIIADLEPLNAVGSALSGVNFRRVARLARIGGILHVAIERTDGDWLALRMPQFREPRWLILPLIAQTLILYICVLLPVLWGARRIARPLNALAVDAQSFNPGTLTPPLPEAGPQDVRAVTTAFNALKLRVTAMIDEKDRMLGAIGHDLRTPLAALRVRVESVDDETDRTRMIETIEEMNRTLDDILSLARLGRPSEPFAETDLTALVDAVVEDFRAIGNPVTFDETARITSPVRPSLMRRAVQNLIENAVKYGTTADVRIVTDAGAVSIVIADHGPGIPADQIEAVFDPFIRLETSRNRETGGVGLGLALARAIVREAGGDIRLENRAGGGLNAIIRLPRN